MSRSHRMKTHTKIMLGAVAAVALVGGAFAATGADAGDRGHGKSWGGHKDMLFERFDANQDGKITQEEIQARKQKSIAEYDADKDGKLSLDEYQGLFNELMRDRMVRMFQKFDRDGDGQVTDAEIQRKLDRMVRRMDRNGDGVIERDDFNRKRRGHDDDDHERGEHRGYRHR